MPYITQSLLYTPGQKQVHLREPCGFDEMTIESTGTDSVLAMLDGLANFGQYRCEVKSIVTADRDRLLAAVYSRLYGDKIDSTLTCPCSQKIDIDFQLSALVQHLADSRDLTDIQVLTGGRFGVGEGSFRLPTGEDELAMQGLPPSEAVTTMLTRCTENCDTDTVQQAMSRVAPLLQTELSASCPDCGQVQQVRFDMQTYLLTRIMQEQRQLMLEVHALALSYKWSYQEVMALPRSRRKLFAQLLN